MIKLCKESWPHSIKASLDLAVFICQLLGQTPFSLEQPQDSSSVSNNSNRPNPYWQLTLPRAPALSTGTRLHEPVFTLWYIGGYIKTIKAILEHYTFILLNCDLGIHKNSDYSLVEPEPFPHFSFKKVTITGDFWEVIIMREHSRNTVICIIIKIYINNGNSYHFLNAY